MDPAHEVVLVAHSFGGLACLTIILQQLAGADDWISQLIMLGTPNRGVPAARLKSFLCTLPIPILCSKDQSVIDMIPKNVDALLNNNFVQPALKYRSVAGRMETS